MLNRQELDDLKARVDIISLIEHDLGPALRQRGRWWWWLCPFHAALSRSWLADGLFWELCPPQGQYPNTPKPIKKQGSL